MDVRKKIDEINAKIKDLTKQRDNLQEYGCDKHEEIIVPYSWRVGAIEDAYVCLKCDKFIEYVAQRQFRLQESCVHEWKEYGKHRLQCYKCKDIKFKQNYLK